MKKVLIISYFFPPCNLTASNRVHIWAKSLKRYGYYPIVITRKWDHIINSPEHMGISSKIQKKKITNSENFRLIQVPYKNSLRDFIYLKKPEWIMLRKILTLKELILQNYRAKTLPYFNIYEEARLILSQENIDKVIISGNPFPLFHFGFLLKKEFKNIHWIADYRDDWTTTELSYPKNIFSKLIFKIEKKSEKKWVGSSSLITSVSEYYVDKISNFTGVKGKVILNGFDDKIVPSKVRAVRSNTFIITYNGSLYPTQCIEPFLSEISKLIELFRNKIRIELRFIGLDFNPEQGNRVRKLLKNVLGNVMITNRIERNEVVKFQQESHILLLVSHKGLKGIPSSKMYEYIGLNKPVLLFPSDNDIMENTLKKTKLGVIYNSGPEIKEKLTKLIEVFIKTKKVNIKGDITAINQFSREEQVKNISKILDELGNK